MTKILNLRLLLLAAIPSILLLGCSSEESASKAENNGVTVLNLFVYYDDETTPVEDAKVYVKSHEFSKSYLALEKTDKEGKVSLRFRPSSESIYLLLSKNEETDGGAMKIKLGQEISTKVFADKLTMPTESNMHSSVGACISYNFRENDSSNAYFCSETVNSKCGGAKSNEYIFIKNKKCADFPRDSFNIGQLKQLKILESKPQSQTTKLKYYLGAQFEDYRAGSIEGVIVRKVVPGSPASQSGLQVNDVILTLLPRSNDDFIQATLITSNTAWDRAVNSLTTGLVSLTVMRNAQVYRPVILKVSLRAN